MSEFTYNCKDAVWFSIGTVVDEYTKKSNTVILGEDIHEAL